MPKNLSTSSFSNLIPGLSKHSNIGEIDFVACLMPVLMLGILLYVIHLARKKNWRYQKYIVVFSLILIFRIVLIGNPASWFIYYKTLNNDDIGFRQHSFLANTIRNYFIPPADIKYLAIGSSQTGSLYTKYAKEFPDFYKIELAGFGPSEYFLYKNLVDYINPEYVLIYISEYDFGRPPSFETFRYANLDLSNYFSYRKIVLEHDKSQRAKDGVNDIILANIFPEYKYSYVFKGYLNKWLKKKDTFNSANTYTAEEEVKVKANFLKKQRSNFSEKSFPITMATFELFLDYCKNQNKKVVVVESHYDPRAYSEANLRLNSQVRTYMKGFVNKYQNIYFMSREELPEVKTEDFTDGVHLRKEVGFKLSELIVQNIKSKF